MLESNTTITLIGNKLARVGAEFIFRGPAAECEKCKLKNTCLNLDKNKKYQVVNVRNGMDHECFLHDTSVRAVEVAPSPIVVSIESRKAFNGSKIVYEEPRCESSCTSYELCHPAGLLNGDRYTIAEVMDEVTGPCEKGLALKKVELRQ
jgi:uncharacterized protein (UPF0179 family)